MSEHCRKCGVELTLTNRYPYAQHRKIRICIGCDIKRTKEWQVKNKTQLKIYNKERWQKKGIEMAKRYRPYSRNYRRKLKEQVLRHYSLNLKCVGWNGVKCPFDCSDMRCLSIDHIEGGGLEHRKKIRSNNGTGFYRWLRDHNYPKGYQVLCMNCQFIKRVENYEY